MSHVSTQYFFSSSAGVKPEVDAQKGDKSYRVPPQQINGWSETSGNSTSNVRRAGITFQETKDGRCAVVFRPKTAVPYSGAAGGVCYSGSKNGGSGALNRDPETYMNFASSKNDSAYYEFTGAVTFCTGFRAGQSK